MSARLGKKKSKNTNYFSHDFIIANHGDIVSLVAMVFVLGLFFKSTIPLATPFIILQHNTTTNSTSDARQTFYYPGMYDLCGIIFYTLMTIVLHAILQEYAFDKICKKSSLSKTRHGRFNNSAHHAVFFAISTYYILYLIISESYITTLSDLWEGYPHLPLSFWGKFFFLSQICYWIHNYPELYFQKVKREDMPDRILHSTLYLIGVSAAYIMGITKLCLAVLCIQFSTDFVYHAARAYSLSGKQHFAKIGFMIWNAVFIPARLLITCLTFLTLQFGMAKETVPRVNLSEMNFNTRILRLNLLLFVFGTQAYMMWLFIKFHLKKQRENRQLASKSNNVDSAHKRKEKKKN